LLSISLAEVEEITFMNARLNALRTISLALCIGLLVSACQTQPSSNSFSSNQAMTAQNVELGMVETVRDVTIQPGNSTLGSATGAVLGGLLGSNIGSGTRANTAGAVAGAVGGGLAGNAIGRGGNTAGVEVGVLLDSGRRLNIVQPGTSNDFRPGDRARVSSGGGTVRVTRG
jgi:outer membrane lipoprotein SlyB